MLPWWGWVLLWVVLLVGGAVLVGLRVRGVWRSLKALTAEISRAADTLEVLDAASDRGSSSSGDEGPGTAVTQDPHRMWAEYRHGRAERSAARADRHMARASGWAARTLAANRPTTRKDTRSWAAESSRDGT